MGFSEKLKSKNPFRSHASSSSTTTTTTTTTTTNSNNVNDYAPPPGPPPPAYTQQQTDYAPPPGPPPSHQPQTQHDWQSAVPDTALFPPPPDIFASWARSPVNNATEAEAEAGEAWCRRYPLVGPVLPPITLPQQQLLVVAPPGGIFAGSVDRLSPRTWRLRTGAAQRDCTTTVWPPAYLVRRDSPLLHPADRDVTRTIYFECVIRRGASNKEVGLGIGFAALPYPAFRMPGWHRASLAVHGDDGHRYVNDRWGGKSFTRAFGAGETVGVGLRFRRRGGVSESLETKVFFTRDGRVEGGWDLHEEADAQQDLPVTGLEGYHDLVVAVGTFGAVDVELVLDPARWAYKEAM